MEEKDKNIKRIKVRRGKNESLKPKKNKGIIRNVLKKKKKKGRIKNH